MFLNIFLNGRVYNSAEWSVARKIIDETFECSRNDGGSDLDGTDEGVSVEFTLSEERLHGVDAMRNFDSYLHVAVNRCTEYGALKWLVTPGSAVPVESATAEHVWISDNPAPPENDPRVISDPDLQRYHHVRSTLPIAAVRAALEEFCRTGTGVRPSAIDWTPGDLSGRRHDAPDPKSSVAYCDDPWCEISEPGHPCH
ncbi:Imm1 family immunity protein [Streptomyces sp. NBC_01358]|uniref:Imm1 family immunity protein n=1 Tax=Streptomyces sp. NBC_01358 TaxID=2903837 RepID=UPI002E348D91|nr:Imm1 family immunity protein [Streptomyces sp. NBC_01358]